MVKKRNGNILYLQETKWVEENQNITCSKIVLINKLYNSRKNRSRNRFSIIISDHLINDEVEVCEKTTDYKSEYQKW